MWLPFLNGIKCYPSAVSNADGDKLVCCTHIDKVEKLEDFFRKKVIEMGDVGGISFGVMSLHDIFKICVPYGISHAWEIGRTVIRATRKKEDPVKAVLKEEKGSLVIISGKVTEVNPPKKKHPRLNCKWITISGSDSYAGHIVIARALNEIYAVLKNCNDKMYACAPNIISMVDPKTGSPITASDRLKGQSVSLICLLSDSKLKVPGVIDDVGPKAYIDLAEEGFTSYVRPSSVLKLK